MVGRPKQGFLKIDLSGDDGILFGLEKVCLVSGSVGKVFVLLVMVINSALVKLRSNSS